LIKKLFYRKSKLFEQFCHLVKLIFFEGFGEVNCFIQLFGYNIIIF